MAIRRFALVAALIPAITLAVYVPGTNTTWNASYAAARLLANSANVPAAIIAAATTAGSTNAVKVASLAITSLTCVPSGPSASGVLVLTLPDSTAALADSQFPRWIAEGLATEMGCHKSQVDVWVKAGTRRLTTDGEGRRLANTVTANYNVYNPNRGRNIGLGIGLGVVAPGLGLGLGLGEGLLRGKTTSAPVVAPVTAAPVPVTTTAAPEEGSSMPLWAGILLGLAVLACIGATVMLSQKKEKKKRAVKKAAPVTEEVRVVEEVVPILAAPPVMQTYQPVPTFQSVVQQAPTVTYAAPAVQTVQAAPQVTYAAPAPAYTSYSRGF